MDAFLPGVEGWEAIYNDPAIWHFRFNGPTPEALVRGGERTYFEHCWNDFAADKRRSISRPDRQADAAAYTGPGRMRSAWSYSISFQQAAADFARFAQTKLSMPCTVARSDEVPAARVESIGRRRSRRPDPIFRSNAVACVASSGVLPFYALFGRCTGSRPLPALQAGGRRGCPWHNRLCSTHRRLSAPIIVALFVAMYDRGLVRLLEYSVADPVSQGHPITCHIP